MSKPLRPPCWCGQEHVARGLCRKHYDQANLRGAFGNEDDDRVENLDAARARFPSCSLPGEALVQDDVFFFTVLGVLCLDRAVREKLA